MDSSTFRPPRGRWSSRRRLEGVLDLFQGVLAELGLASAAGVARWKHRRCDGTMDLRFSPRASQPLLLRSSSAASSAAVWGLDRLLLFTIGEGILIPVEYQLIGAAATRWTHPTPAS